MLVTAFAFFTFVLCLSFPIYTTVIPVCDSFSTFHCTVPRVRYCINSELAHVELNFFVTSAFMKITPNICDLV